MFSGGPLAYSPILKLSLAASPVVWAYCELPNKHPGACIFLGLRVGTYSAVGENKELREYLREFNICHKNQGKIREFTRDEFGKN